MNTVNVVEINSVRNAAMENLTRFINEAVSINKEQIAFTVKHKGNNETPEQIINHYVDYLLMHGLSHYSQQDLLSLISSGVIFEAREMFIEKLMSEEVIMMVVTM